MQDPHIFEGCTDISEAANDGVIQLEVLEAGKDLTGNLQTVTCSIDAQLQLRQHSQLADFDAPERHRQELLVEVDDILDLLVVHDLHEVVLHICESAHLADAGDRFDSSVFIIFRLLILHTFRHRIQIAAHLRSGSLRMLDVLGRNYLLLG